MYAEGPPVATIIGIAQQITPAMTAAHARSLIRFGIVERSKKRTAARSGSVRMAVCERNPAANPAMNAPASNNRSRVRRLDAFGLADPTAATAVIEASATGDLK